MKSIASSGVRVYCIDVDGAALRDCRQHVPDLARCKAHFIHTDFLQWKCADSSFDCIVMNPPFAARKRSEVKVEIGRPGRAEMCLRSAPIELAFVLKSIRLLKPGGKLLAILPSSAVSSGNQIWFRQYV